MSRGSARALVRVCASCADSRRTLPDRDAAGPLARQLGHRDGLLPGSLRSSPARDGGAWLDASRCCGMRSVLLASLRRGLPTAGSSAGRRTACSSRTGAKACMRRCSRRAVHGDGRSSSAWRQRRRPEARGGVTRRSVTRCGSCCGSIARSDFRATPGSRVMGRAAWRTTCGARAARDGGRRRSGCASHRRGRLEAGVTTRSRRGCATCSSRIGCSASRRALDCNSTGRRAWRSPSSAAAARCTGRVS